MEPISPLQNENIQLKQIIRENDNRICYLEQKLNNATQIINCILDEGSIDISQYTCRSCREIYLYDEYPCSCNIFCRKSLCKECYLFFKSQTEHLICQHPKCRKWYCNNETCFLQVCRDCTRRFCTKEYEYSNIKKENWICKDCGENATRKYGFEPI